MPYAVVEFYRDPDGTICCAVEEQDFDDIREAEQFRLEHLEAFCFVPDPQNIQVVQYKL